MAEEKKQSSTEKINLLRNRKVLLGLTALAILIVVICLFSFVPYTISSERLTEPSFIVDLLMLCVITIFALLGMLYVGQASNAQNPKSKIAKATVEFKISKEEVKKRGLAAFKQWVANVLQVQDKETIKQRTLEEKGIEDLSILKLNIHEIEQLTKPQKFNGEFYDCLTKEQIDLVKRIKTKGIQLKFVPPEYYLSVQGIKDARTRSERAGGEGAQKGRILFSSITSKILLTIAFSVVWALFARDLASGEYTAIEIATKLFSRLFAFFTSAFMGYIVGCQINDIDAEYIEMRTSVHTDFLEDKDFVAKDVKEIAKEAFINRVKEEQVIQGLEERPIGNNTNPLVPIKEE